MIDFVDKVKSFESQNPIPNEKWKDYDENLVLAFLLYYNYNAYCNLVHKDSPDLQDAVSSYGIEVTRAHDKDDYIIQGELTKYKLGKSNKTIDDLQEIVKEHSWLFEPEIGAFCPPMYDENHQFHLFKTAFNKKINKLPLYNSNVSSCSLAVVFQEPLLPRADNLMIDYFKEINFKNKTNNKFNSLFLILETEGLIILDSSLRVIKKNFNYDELKYLCNVASLVTRGLETEIKTCFIS